MRQREELRKFAGLAVPRHALDTSPPRLKSGINLTWDETLAIRQTLDDTIARSESPLSVRLLRALQWIALLDQARLTSVRGDRLAELVTLLASATHDEFPDSSSLESIDPVTRVGAAQFRLLAGQYAREDIQGRRRRGLIDRLHLLRAAWTLSTGRGSLPHLNHRLRTLPFDRLEQSFGPLPPSSDEILTRYLRVKIQGLHFCGRASYDAPLIEGFHALALTIPATLWISRWLAASDDRTLLTVDDVAEALALVDHQHGFSNAFGSFGFRGRVRTLARLGDIPRLIAKYVR